MLEVVLIVLNKLIVKVVLPPMCVEHVMLDIVSVLETVCLSVQE